MSASEYKQMVPRVGDLHLPVGLGRGFGGVSGFSGVYCARRMGVGFPRPYGICFT